MKKVCPTCKKVFDVNVYNSLKIYCCDKCKKGRRKWVLLHKVGLTSSKNIKKIK